MKFKKPLKITSRSSSVTNGFVQAIIPSVEPTPEKRTEALAQLGMTNDAITCIYCGAFATDWDHLRPLVRKKRPTGYINEVRNLVPSCGPCNQSKSGSDWRRWMVSAARGSPKAKGVTDLDERIARLEAFEAWGKVEPLDLRDLAGAAEWEAYWQRLATIEREMQEAQLQASELQAAIRRALNTREGAVSFGTPASAKEDESETTV
jgi:hypothetical protein